MDEEPTKPNPLIWCSKVAIISLAIFLLCPAGIIMFAKIAPYVHQSEYTYVGENFAFALMQNNSRLAHRLSAPSQWERIDDWLSLHESFKCPFTLDFDANKTIVIGAPNEIGAHISFFHLCYVEDYYEFEIEEIILRRHEERWQVVDWSEALEMR